MNVNKFQKYDFHYWSNLLIYGQFSPPQYDLTKVTAPVALFHSDADVTTQPQDVQMLKNKLPNLVYEKVIDPELAYGHLDFVWAKNLRENVNDPVLSLIQGY